MTKWICKILLFVATFVAWAGAGVVSTHGRLQTEGNKIIGKVSNQDAQVRGASLGWSNWGSKFFTATAVNHLVDDWKADVIRVPLGISTGSDKTSTGTSVGYLVDPSTNLAWVEDAVNAAIAKDVYVIVDWHSHNAENELVAAKAFFGYMAKNYGGNPHVIYEVYNEPECEVVQSADGSCSSYTSWATIKTYAEEVIDTIRDYDPDNLILVGTPKWDQLVNAPVTANSYITDSGDNVAYVFHFYAYSHTLANFQSNIDAVLNSNHAVFVSEYGTTHADGGNSDAGHFATHNSIEADKWHTYLDSKKISSCAWQVNDAYEGAAYFGPKNGTFDTTSSTGWTDIASMTASGQYIYSLLNHYGQCSAWRNGNSTSCTPDGSLDAKTAVTLLWTPSMETPNNVVDGIASAGPFPFISSTPANYTVTDSTASGYGVSFPVNSTGSWKGGGLSFPLAKNENTKDMNYDVDISTLGGICMSYANDFEGGFIQLNHDDWPNVATQGFEKATSKTTAYLPLSGFEDNSGADASLDIIGAVKDLHIRVPSAVGTYNLTLYGIGFAASTAECSALFADGEQPAVGLPPVAGLDTLWTPLLAVPNTVVENYTALGPFPFASATSSIDTSRNGNVFTAHYTLALDNNWAGGGIDFPLAATISGTDTVRNAVDLSGLGGLCVSYAGDFDSGSGFVRVSTGAWPDEIGMPSVLPSSTMQKNVFVSFADSWTVYSTTLGKSEILANAKNVQVRLNDAVGNQTLKLYGVAFASSTSSCNTMFPVPLPSTVLWAPATGNIGDENFQLVSVDGTSAGGSWYSTTDAADASNPGLSYALPSSSELSAEVSNKQYLKGELHLKNAISNPWGHWAFYWNQDQTAVDVTMQGGVCVTYAASHDVMLKLDGAYGKNDLFSDTLKASSAWNTVNIPFAGMKQAGWGTAVDLDSALAGLVTGLRFWTEAALYKGSPENVVFNIAQVGWSGECDASIASALTVDLGVTQPAPVLAWSPNEHGASLEQLNTLVENTTAGSWYTYTDATSGGKSTVVPAEGTTNTYFSATGSATAAIRLADGYDYPYGGLGFDFVKNKKANFDASSYDSVCMVYRAPRPFRMMVHQSNEKGWSYYGYNVESSETFRAMNIAIADLARLPGDGENDFNLSPALFQSVVFQFNQGVAGSAADVDSSNTIEINQFGFGDACDMTSVPDEGMSVSTTNGLVYDVTTSLGDAGESHKAGEAAYWYTFADENGSTVSPAGATADSPDYTELMVDSAGVIALTATLGSDATNGLYAVAAFDWAENGGNSEKTKIDLSAHQSLCVTYRSSTVFEVVLEQGYASNPNMYAATLPVQTAFKAYSIDFDDFAQQNNQGYSQVLDLKRQMALRFELRDLVNASGTLEIAQVGFDGACKDVDLAPVVVGATINSQVLGYTGAALNIDEDEVIRIPASAFKDPEGGALTLSITNGSTEATAVQDANGNLVVTPVAEFNGALDLVVRATDAAGNSRDWTIVLTVNAVDDAPVVAAGLLKDIVLIGNSSRTVDTVGVFDSKGENDVSVAVSQSVATDYVEAVLQNGALVVTVSDAAAFLGTGVSRMFTVTLAATDDPHAGEYKASFNVTVRLANNLPKATAAVLAATSFNEEESLAINPEATDHVLFSDADLDPLSYSLVCTEGCGKVTLDGLTLTGVKDSTGAVKVALTATDNVEGTTPASRIFELTINNLNDVPVATVAGKVVSMNEEASLIIDPAGLFSDADIAMVGDKLTYALSSNSNKVTLDQTMLTVKGLTDSVGTVLFDLIATDIAGKYATIPYALTISNENDAPVTTTVVYADTTLDEESTLDLGSADLDKLFADVDHDKLTYSLSSTSGKVVTNGLKVTGAKDSTGTAGIVIVASDGKLTAQSSFTLILKNVNDAPVAKQTTLAKTMDEDGSLELTAAEVAALFSDVDDASLTYALSTTSAKVAVTDLKITGAKDANGLVGLTLTAQDDDKAVASIVLNLTVDAKPDAIVAATAVPSVLTFKEDGSLTLATAGLFVDVDGDAAYTLTSTSQKVSISGLKVSGVTDSSGEVLVVLTAKNAVSSVSRSFTLSITAQNDLPVLVGELKDTAVVVGFKAMAIYLGKLFSDAEGDDVTYSVNTSDVVTLTVDGDTLRIVSITGKSGEVTVSVSANDGTGSTTVDFFLNVKAAQTRVELTNAAVRTTWQNALQATHGSATLYDSRGRVLLTVALPASSHEVLDAVRVQGGLAILRVGGNSWSISASAR